MKRRSALDSGPLLRTGRWFSGLPPALGEALLGAARVRTLRSAELLFARGDPPDGLYAVVEGAIRITGLAESGKEALLTLMEPPHWFGEVSVFDGQPRTHDALAVGAARIVHVPQDAILGILAAEPRYWRDLGLLLAGKLRLAFVALEDAALLPAATRLARRLVLMAEGYGERPGPTRRVLDVRQEQLATMLAISRQTANQLLKDLEGRGLVRLSYGGIEIVDLPGLRAAAGPPDQLPGTMRKTSPS